MSSATEVKAGPGWVHFAEHVCGGTSVEGGVVHAVDFFARPLTSKRRTFDAACGARVRLLGAPVKNGGTCTLIWPPYVEGAASLGLTRCPDCYRLTGRKRPDDGMGSVEWHDARKKGLAHE